MDIDDDYAAEPTQPAFIAEPMDTDEPNYELPITAHSGLAAVLRRVEEREMAYAGTREWPPLGVAVTRFKNEITAQSNLRNESKVGRSDFPFPIGAQIHLCQCFGPGRRLRRLRSTSPWNSEQSKRHQQQQ